MLVNKEITKLIGFLEKENNWFKNNIEYWEQKEDRDSYETKELENQMENLEV